MRRLSLVFLTAVLVIGLSISAGWSVPPAGEPSISAAAAPSPATLLELTNGTGFAHPAIGAQGGLPQFLILILRGLIPAANNKGAASTPATTTGNQPVNVGNNPTTSTNAADTRTAGDNLWSLRRQLDRIVRTSRGSGLENGTAANLAKVDARLLALERTRMQTLTGIVRDGDPASAAYANAVKELAELKERLRALSPSDATAVIDGAEALINDVDGALEEALTERSYHLQSVLGSAAADAATKTAAAAELVAIRNRLGDLDPTGRATGGIDVALDEYFRSKIDALTAVLDDAAASTADKAAALNELRMLGKTLLDYVGERPSLFGPSLTSSSALLGEVEKRLVDTIRTRLAELGSAYDNASSTQKQKAEALTEMFSLWNDLRRLTAGQTVRRNEGDTSHDDLIRDLGNRLVSEIGRRFTELATSLTANSSTAELGAASSELFAAWDRLRALGQTDTELYANLETTLRELYEVQSVRLIDTLNDDTATDAARAAAATALTNINRSLAALDGTRQGANGNRFEDPTRIGNNESLGSYARERIDRLGAVLDSTTATATDKAAAINELRQLRSMLISLGRRTDPLSFGSGRGDIELGDIDRRLRAAATLRLNEVARTIGSSTATAAEVQAAVGALEDLRREFRDFGDPTGDVETRIDRLLQQGTGGRLQQLENDLEGGGVATPIASRFTVGGAATTVDLASNPGAVASSLLDFENFGRPGGPTLAVLARSTGVSTGPGSMEFVVANAGGETNLEGNGLVVEPLTGDPARIEEVWSALLERANAAISVTPDGYCLEKDQRPPSPTELYSIASAGKQSLFAPARDILRASEELFTAGQLNPEEQSDPDQYFHSIRQWAIWAEERGYDEASFTTDFVAHTRKNVEERGFQWSAEIEEQVRGWAPNRWQDVSNVLTAAGIGTA